jgi:hypothetical protein
MKNKKTTTKKSTKKVASKLVKTNTVNGIETLPSGSYRVRKTVNGVKHSFITSKRRDAVAFRDTLKSM